MDPPLLVNFEVAGLGAQVARGASVTTARRAAYARTFAAAYRSSARATTASRRAAARALTAPAAATAAALSAEPEAAAPRDATAAARGAEPKAAAPRAVAVAFARARGCEKPAPAPLATRPERPTTATARGAAPDGGSSGHADGPCDRERVPPQTTAGATAAVRDVPLPTAAPRLRARSTAAAWRLRLSRADFEAARRFSICARRGAQLAYAAAASASLHLPSASYP